MAYPPEKVLPKVIDLFQDDNLRHKFQSQVRPAITLQREVNREQFVREFLNNPDSHQCFLQLASPHCAACRQSKPILGALSRKLEKHGMLGDLPFFRMSGEDLEPVGGSIGYTPAYIFLRKQGNSLCEI